MDDFSQRLQRLEEAHAFGEHTMDQLAEEVRRAFAEIETLRKRLDLLEQAARAGDDAPPDGPGEAEDAGSAGG